MRRQHHPLPYHLRYLCVHVVIFPDHSQMYGQSLHQSTLRVLVKMVRLRVVQEGLLNALGVLF